MVKPDLTKSNPSKSSDPKEKKDEKKTAPPTAIVPKNKLRTEGVSELKYDRYSATSFSNFERDMRLAAGQEFGDLFGQVVQGAYTPDNSPEPTTVELKHEEAVWDIESQIQTLNAIPAPRTQEQDLEHATLVANKQTLQDSWLMVSIAKKKVLNLKLEEDYKTKMKVISNLSTQYSKDKPKLYWKIRCNMSEESTDKVKEHLGVHWESCERDQDPVELWKAIKCTHTAYSTGNPFTDKQALRQGYNDMKMFSGETLINLKLRITTALRAMESLKMTIPVDEDQAADFIAKLDQRWSSLKTQLANDYIRGMTSAQPKTLMDAYQLAAGWKVIITNPNGMTSTVLATASVITTTKKPKGEGDGKPTKTGKGKGTESDKESEKKTPEYGCHICGDKHFVKDCPFKAEAKKAIDELKASRASSSTQPTQSTEGAAPAKGSRARNVHFSSTSFTTLSFLSSAENEWLKDRILFDPQAQSSSFCNKDLLTNISEKAVPVRYTGQTKGQDIATQEGKFMEVINVDYNPEFATNILGGAEMKHIYGFEWGYDSPSDHFYLNIGEKQLCFNMENFLYTYNPSEDQEIANTFTTMMTKDQERKAALAHDLIKRLGYPSPQRVITAIREGSIINTDISPEDVRRADAIYGRHFPYLAGKSVWRDPSIQDPISAATLPETVLEGHTDLMFVGDLIALVTVFKPIDLTLLNILPSEGKEAKKEAFTEQLSILKAAGFTVSKIWGDAGDGYETCMKEIQGPRFEHLSPGRHDGVIEAKIRRIKETMRSLLNSLPYKFGPSLLRYAMRCATYYMNLFPTRTGFKGISPREALTGIKVDAAACAGIAFGEFAYVKEKGQDKSMNSRVFPAIALLPTGTRGGVLFLNLETMETYIRDQYTIHQMPQERIDQLTLLGTYSMEDIAQLLGVQTTPDQETDDDLIPSTVTNMTIEQAARVYGDEMAEESLVKEFKQYIDKKSLKGVLASVVIPKDEIVPFKTFAKAKEDPDGNFKSLKTRGVGRGDKQTLDIYEKMPSTTASTQSLLTMAAIGAHEDKKSATYDVPGGYLNSRREGRAPPVYI